ncbi:MAG: hypothetical protein R3229_04860 [Alphaproteobacteria bacterium]|nr:hypothetical protein [Alphaproteobacteria bacterium]
MVQVKGNGGVQAAARPPGAVVHPRIGGETVGKPEFDRRLSDKILAAFNHAYASGAHKVAERLRTVLADVEKSERVEHDRRTTSAVSQADLWVAFVEARNSYNDLVSRGDAPAEQVEIALNDMKDAYRLWANT